MIPATDAENYAAIGEYVGHRVVFGEPERMPHWNNVEGAAELERFGVSGHVGPKQDDVGDALVSLTLEVVLGHPKCVKSEIVHEPGYLSCGVQAFHEPVVGVSPLVGRRSIGADVFKIDVADVED